MSNSHIGISRAVKTLLFSYLIVKHSNTNVKGLNIIQNKIVGQLVGQLIV